MIWNVALCYPQRIGRAGFPNEVPVKTGFSVTCQFAAFWLGSIYSKCDSKEHCAAAIAQLQQLNNVVHIPCIVGSKAVLNVLGLPN